MVPKESGVDLSATASCSCARRLWGFLCSPATARDGKPIQMSHSFHHVVHTIATVLTTSVQEPTEDDGSSHSGMAGPDRGFSPTSKLHVAQSFAPMAVTAGRCSGGGSNGDPLLAVCLWTFAAGKPNPGPDTPRTDIPTPCEEPLVTPHRRQTTKSVNDNAGAAPHVNCMQCNRTSPDQPTIKCSICRGSIHLGCLKAGNYLEGQGWRKQEPPQYIGQLFNSLTSNSSVTRASRNLPPSYKTISVSPCVQSNINLTFLHLTSLAQQLIRTLTLQPADRSHRLPKQQLKLLSDRSNNQTDYHCRQHIPLHHHPGSQTKCGDTSRDDKQRTAKMMTTSVPSLY